MSESYEMDNDLGGLDNVDADFNVDADYKPTPIASPGFYSGNVTGVALDPKHACIVWDVTLADNEDTLCNDGETSVNGIGLQYRNFLPKLNDRNTLNKKGVTKFQSKVNMLRYFSEGMGINMTTLPVIIEAIENGEWIGLEVTAKVTVDSYQGRPNNKIDQLASR
jgi:hypothetical protein